MLLAYIENGNTTFYSIPNERINEFQKEIDFISKYDLEAYRVGQMYNSIHAKEVASILPIDAAIIVLNNFKKYFVDRETAIELYQRLDSILNSNIKNNDDESEKHLVVAKKGNQLLLFYVDNNINKDDKNECYRKYYVGSMLDCTYTRELLLSMQVEFMANQEETETAIKKM